MILSKLIEGLQTLKPYYEGGDGYQTGAEHDEIFAYATDRPLSPEDVQKMQDLGWDQPEVEDPEIEGERAPYDPEDGWRAFT